MTDRFMHFRIANTVGQAFQIKSINASKLRLNKLQAILSFSIDIINISIYCMFMPHLSIKFSFT